MLFDCFPLTRSAGNTSIQYEYMYVYVSVFGIVLLLIFFLTPPFKRSKVYNF